MSKWSRTLPDQHKIIVAKQDKNIVAWAAGEKYIIPEHKTIFNEHTCLVGVYVQRQYRKNGIGTKMGVSLFKLLKSEGFSRIYMNFHDKKSSNMYNNICNIYGTRRKPFIINSENVFYSPDWKIVKI